MGLDKRSLKKTTFVTRKRSYKFKVLAFGSSNAPAIFHHLMDLVLEWLAWQICLAFLDDIIIMSDTFDQELLFLVFEKLKSANSKLKPSKCKLFQKRVKFLGSIFWEAGIEPDLEKVEAVKEWLFQRR